MATTPLSMAGITRVELPGAGGDWVKFRNCLNWAEDMRLSSDTFILETVTETSEDGEEREITRARVDWGIYQIHRLAAYLKEWSFRHADGVAPLPVTVANIGKLRPEVGEVLIRLLGEHLAEQTLKNEPASTPA